MLANIFGKTSIVRELPAGMVQVISELKISSNQEECLRKAYDILTSKYQGFRLKTYTRFFDLYSKDVNDLWDRGGFLHCTNLNYLLNILLVESGHFKDSDMELKWTLVWGISPHQYLSVKLIDGRTIDVDMWGKAYGIPFGKHAHGFQ